MRNIIWFITVFILLLIQGGILQPLHISPVNLILVVVAIATILSDFNQGLIITLMGGLMLDFISGFPDGMVSISLVAAFLLIHLILNEVLSREPNRFILLVSVVGTTIIYFLVFFVFGKIFTLFNLSPNIDIDYMFSVQLPLMLMWNILFAYPIFQFYQFVQNLVSKLPHNQESIKL